MSEQKSWVRGSGRVLSNTASSRLLGYDDLKMKDDYEETRVINYEYTVNGEHFSGSYEMKAPPIDTYQVGAEVTVYHQSEQPSVSALEVTFAEEKEQKSGRLELAIGLFVLSVIAILINRGCHGGG